jgi:proteasome accessory factor PafA2
MAVPKVLGIETEYGISVPGVPDANPITASSGLINGYLAQLSGRTNWDFVDESPGQDARGFTVDTGGNIELETHLVNAVLTNGARLYVDHAHPEYSSPECRTPREAVLYDKAGEEVMRRAMRGVQALNPHGPAVVVYKNNSDRKGNSYGCHENYLMDRQVPFAKIVAELVPFFVTRQIMVGAGKVGSEAPGVSIRDVPYQLSQRADFFEEEVGLETTLKRPIINTRDEPHSDSQRYRRLHVIIGDANLSEVATWLKLGTTAIVLAMIEDGDLEDLGISIVDPVGSLRRVSWDPALKATMNLADGRTMRALDVQWQYLERAQRWLEREGGEAVGGEHEAGALIEEWESVLNGLERDPLELADRLDWVAKWVLIQGYLERHHLDIADVRAAALDLQYHDVRPERSLYQRLRMRRLTTDEEVERATVEPPPSTRAYFRGRCLAQFPGNIAAANWDSIIFDVGSDPLRRVPMMDPLRGTKELVGSLLDSVGSVTELLDALGA